MLTDFQRRKLAQSFQMYDFDDDGFVEEADYRTFADRLAGAFQQEADSAATQQLHAMFMGQWQGMQQYADTDGDNRVGIDECLRFYEHLLSTPEGLDSYIAGFLDGSYALWDIVDPEGPKQATTRDRYVRWLTAFKVSQRDAETAFEHMDTDGDGLIDRAEMTLRIREWLGNDPDAPGSWIMGRSV